jgi:hypothetical protein
MLSKKKTAEKSFETILGLHFRNALSSSKDHPNLKLLRIFSANLFDNRH